MHYQKLTDKTVFGIQIETGKKKQEREKRNIKKESKIKYFTTQC